MAIHSAFFQTLEDERQHLSVGRCRGRREAVQMLNQVDETQCQAAYSLVARQFLLSLSPVSVVGTTTVCPARQH